MKNTFIAILSIISLLFGYGLYQDSSIEGISGYEFREKILGEENFHGINLEYLMWYAEKDILDLNESLTKVNTENSPAYYVSDYSNKIVFSYSGYDMTEVSRLREGFSFDGKCTQFLIKINRNRNLMISLEKELRKLDFIEKEDGEWIKGGTKVFLCKNMETANAELCYKIIIQITK